MQNSSFLILYFVIGMVALVSCAEEVKKPEAKDMIIGKWEIEEGYRNGKLANSLEGLYFEFDPNGKMTTNLLGNEETNDYRINEDTLFQLSTEPVNYAINQLDSTMLTLTFTLRGFDFRLKMKKEE